MDKYGDLVNTPLMERFRDRAPASAKHCANVAQMAAAIANELDSLDKALLDIAALYHDIGKLVNPKYYSENQDGDNPHDKLPPHISFLLISGHVAASGALLAQHGFPHEVIQVVLEHHGNTVQGMAFKDVDGDPENYRYPWSPPGTMESAILMICDVCEAKAKSHAQQGILSDPDKLVAEVVQGLNEDDQLDIMTFGVGKVVKKVLAKELQTLYHKRVAYPADEGSEDK
jgi:cyclic-di-AMP phosphodiesterase PgpH